MAERQPRNRRIVLVADDHLLGKLARIADAERRGVREQVLYMLERAVRDYELSKEVNCEER
ncbi:MAG: hypothetical protein KatS3mg050_1837 [Litorilinea sp.]|nr:MAG: hypothetical protein KatS3mg050_1837 [Litorilinea sp.]